MDEHKHSGMTEFLKKELRAWEEASAERGVLPKRSRRLPNRIAIIAIATVVVLATVAVVCLAPWRKAESPEEGNGQNGGDAQPPVTEESGTLPEAESDTEELQMSDPYAYDFSAVPQGAVPIVPADIRATQNPVNQTDGEIDMAEVMAAFCRIPAPRGKISVLIIHTHTGEGYNREGASYLASDDEEFARSEDGTDGVVAVGARIAQALNDAGVGTIHCKTVFDGESNREAYARAAEAIAAFRLAYPGLVCVIDVHRAATTDEDGNIVRSLAVMDGQGMAQAQVIVGMNAGTSKTNLALAMQLCNNMNARFDGSCASVICKSQSLHGELLPFALTLEIGSCGNTIEEALRTADVAAQGLVGLFETP